MRISMKEATMALGMMLGGNVDPRRPAIDRPVPQHDWRLDSDWSARTASGFWTPRFKNVEVNDVQVDEIWSFVGMKEKTRVARGYSTEFGDSWTFIGIERDTKLILAHQVGQRDSEYVLGVSAEAETTLSAAAVSN